MIVCSSFKTVLLLSGIRGDKSNIGNMVGERKYFQ